jgi:N-acyl-D-amino-acid deacylase
VGEYLRAFDRGSTALNVVQLVGHGTLRVAAMGFARRPPTAAELTAMQRMLGEAMEEGAWGLSTGLIYAPGSYATTEEIIEVAKAAVRQRGFYASHIRGEGATLLAAVREAIRIGRDADLPVQISHVKASGRPNWGKVADALALVDEARAEGLDVMGDVYPYTASSTSLRTLLPDWVLEGGVESMLERIQDAAVRGQIRKEIQAPGTGQGLLDRIGWDNIMIAWCPTRKEAEGRSIAEVAASRTLDPLDAVFELLRDAQGVASVIMFQLDESDLRRALAHPHVMIGSDGSALATSGEMSAGKPHPRSYGTFPRVLGEYVREQRVLSLSEAVHKMTGLPARRLGLRDRGQIRAGARADLVVFDARRIADRATYDDPHRYAVGVEHVLVNGSIVIKDGEHTGSLPGRVLTPP